MHGAWYFTRDERSPPVGGREPWLREVRVLSRTVTGGFGEGEPGAVKQEARPSDTPVAPGAPGLAGGSRLGRAGAIGAVLAGLLFLAVLLNGSATLLGKDLQSDFYDVQAHSLLAGHWDVSPRALGLEGFHIGGKNYMYFGPVPALLRLPVAAVTHRFDGRLSQISMLLAFAVAMFFTVRLVLRTRRLVRGDEPASTLECWAVGAFVFVSGASVLLFLATRLIVFHEAEIWGVALALGAFDFLIAYVDEPSALALIGASALATAAMLSRATVGLGPVATLGVLVVASLIAPIGRFFGLTERHRQVTGWLVLAVAIPVVLYVYVNYAKFQTPLGLPFDRQFVTFVSPEHRHVLAVNGGSLFGLQFVPTNVVQYLRPDGIELSALWPWVRFPGLPILIGGVTYDRITPTTSVVAAMPLHALLAVVGLVAMISPRRARENRTRVLRAPVLGAAAGTIPVLAFGFMAQRYLGDFVPLLVLLGAVGLYVALSWCSRREAQWSRAVVVGGLAVVTVVAVWFSVGLAIMFQQVTSATDTELRGFVRSQLAVQRRFPGGAPDVVHVRTLPKSAPLGTVVVVGDCDGVLVSAGFGWRVLERTPATGGYSLRVRFAPAAGASGARVVAPLLSAGSARAPEMFFVETKPNGARVFGYSAPDGLESRSRPVRLDPNRSHLLGLMLDLETQEVAVDVDGHQVLYRTTIPAVRKIVAPLGRVRIGDGAGRSPAPGRFPGRIEVVKRRPQLCRELTQ